MIFIKHGIYWKRLTKDGSGRRCMDDLSGLPNMIHHSFMWDSHCPLKKSDCDCKISKNFQTITTIETVFQDYQKLATSGFYAIASKLMPARTSEC